MKMQKYLLVVNYHYIREKTPPRGIYPITPKAFTNQLDRIAKNNYHFISLAQLNHGIQTQDTSLFAKKNCLITFDDGLRESYECGLSILNKKGIPGVFFIVGDAIAREKVLDVHKFHYVQSKMTVVEILEEISLENKKFPIKQIQSQYPWDTLEAAKIKYLFNFLFSPLEKKRMINKLFRSCVSSEPAFAQKLYMTRLQIQNLAKQEYLGNHGKSHVPLAGLEKSKLQNELQYSQRQLTKITNKNITSISYPFGGATAVNHTVITTASKHNFISGFTMSRGLNCFSNIFTSPLEIMRFDTNDVFGGKSEHLYKDQIR